ncbi:hypothetical protein [Lentzea sp. NEAU-D7]|uniref:hypothetical protein n=1 Tax=Lentzea sp. NEAU-D7 TaxID=2994667 RepID=UPI00224B7EC9|nr:hypothetical protein [Lentzea sp. NEAU-D7]MCX2950179.1 hypothetical protein [Lentzea sp. NEAU-D7]
MKISAVAASDLRTEVFQVNSAGDLEHRWLDTTRPAAEWTAWRRAPFEPVAVAVAAISGWAEQIEVFVLDTSGTVWNRWWWHDRGWTPVDRFNPLGAPFGRSGSRDLSALSAGNGHFNVFVGAEDGRLAVLPHINGPQGPYWHRCDTAERLGDGWWPAFSPASTGAYRHPER